MAGAGLLNPRDSSLPQDCGHTVPPACDPCLKKKKILISLNTARTRPPLRPPTPQCQSGHRLCRLDQASGRASRVSLLLSQPPEVSPQMQPEGSRRDPVFPAPTFRHISLQSPRPESAHPLGPALSSRVLTQPALPTPPLCPQAAPSVALAPPERSSPETCTFRSPGSDASFSGRPIRPCPLPLPHPGRFSHSTYHLPTHY